MRSEAYSQIFTQNGTLNLNTTGISWLQDIYLEEYIKTFSSDTSKLRNYVLILGPSTSQLLKCGNSFQILEVATSLTLYIFFCVSDFTETNIDSKELKTNGSHWSILILNRINKEIYHFDSISGFNNIHAKNCPKTLLQITVFHK